MTDHELLELAEKALEGLHRVCALALTGKNGEQHVYFETRAGHFVAADKAMDSAAESIAAIRATREVRDESVAEVVWFDPATLTMPEKAGKIIDGSMAFIESAEIGTKLYARPQPAPASVKKIASLIVRDVCETDPSNPDNKDTLLIGVDQLSMIVESVLDEYSAPQPTNMQSEAAVPVAWEFEQYIPGRGWEWHTQKDRPLSNDGFRNFKPLFTAPQPAHVESRDLVSRDAYQGAMDEIDNLKKTQKHMAEQFFKLDQEHTKAMLEIESNRMTMLIADKCISGYYEENTTLKEQLLATPQPAMREWQPIDTAPNDGRTVLLGYHNSLGNWRTMRGRYFTREQIDSDWENGEDCPEGWYETSVECSDDVNCWYATPTHWMPLPTAPAAMIAAAAAPSVTEGWNSAIEAVAKMLDKKADDYALEFGYDDMGGLSFGIGIHAEVKTDHHSTLIYLAEEVRAMLAAAPTPDHFPDAGEMVADAPEAKP